ISNAGLRARALNRCDKLFEFANVEAISCSGATCRRLPARYFTMVPTGGLFEGDVKHEKSHASIGCGSTPGCCGADIGAGSNPASADPDQERAPRSRAPAFAGVAPTATGWPHGHDQGDAQAQ